MAELPRRQIGQIRIPSRVVPGAVNTLAPVEKVGEGITNAALATFKSAFGELMEGYRKTEELKFQAQAETEGARLQADLQDSINNLLAAGKTEEVTTLFAKGGVADQMIEARARQFGDGLYGTRARTAFENIKANAMVSGVSAAARRNVEIARDAKEVALTNATGLAGIGQLVQANASVDAIMAQSVKEGLYAKPEADQKAYDYKIRNARNMSQYLLSEAEVRFQQGGYEEARAYLEAHDQMTSAVPKEVRAEIKDTLKSKIVQLEQRQQAVAMKAENDAINSATKSVSRAATEAENLLRAGNSEAALERINSIKVVMQDENADPRVQEVASYQINRLAPTIQKAEYYVGLSKDVDAAMQGQYKPLPKDAEKTLDVKLTRMFAALPADTPTSRKVSYVNVAVANTGLVPEQANLQYEQALREAGTASGADRLADLWDEANALQNGAVASKIMGDRKGPGLKINAFVSEYRRRVLTEIPEHVRNNPQQFAAAKQQIAASTLQTVNAGAKPEMIDNRMKEFDKVSTQKAFESAYGSKGKNVMENTVPGFNFTEQKAGAFVNANKVKAEIMDDAKDLYANGMEMEQAVEAATKMAMTRWVWTGKGWANQNPHSLSPSGQVDPRVTKDIQDKLVSGGFVLPKQAGDIAKAAQFLGNPEDGYIVFLNQGAGVVPITDDDGNLFVYKPGN